MKTILSVPGMVVTSLSYVIMAVGLLLVCKKWKIRMLESFVASMREQIVIGTIEVDLPDGRS